MALSTRGPQELGPVLRDAYRAFYRALQQRIAPHGVTMGQWFFLRALWELDGVTQRELSQRVGMMEPTTVTALNGMERSGLVRRVRNPHDRRKVNVYLTDRGRELKTVLLPCLADVSRAAVVGLDHGSIERATQILNRMTANLDGAHLELDA
ncbi:MarR family winged helix-turn-helix transcriptional regulator [Rhodospirillum centenum]|uniref:Transcriptional regulator, MarR family protein n=1 Tax=Rhodospirillum centenum (strain ATCC 51521 / SW) TaxID=414684 RepID=B6IRK9_RHOCS|nr:MarR family transcriptional regulator [Rhodospirillum centenum]ACI98095.1 transcriptional regulator, MarR family protein [Rhodospirillum centenum SW]